MKRRTPATKTRPRHEEPETVPLSDEEAETERPHEPIENSQEAFEELEAAFVPEEEPEFEVPELSPVISANEFVCRSCFLVFDRRRLGDREEMTCADCARETEPKRKRERTRKPEKTKR